LRARKAQDARSGVQGGAVLPDRHALMMSVRAVAPGKNNAENPRSGRGFSRADGAHHVAGRFLRMEMWGMPASS